MDRKFDVAKWRNDQYSKEIEQIDTVSQLKNIIKEEIKNFLTENVIKKKIEDLEWEDVEGLSLPTSSTGVMASMNSSKDLDSWKNKFKETDLEVTIDRNADLWFNKVTIKNLNQSDYIGQMAKTDPNPKLD